MAHRKDDEAVSPAEAQNTGPAHRTPPGAQEHVRDGDPGSKARATRDNPVRPGGEPETSDDR